MLGPGAARGQPPDGAVAAAGPRTAASPRIAVYFVVAGQVRLAPFGEMRKFVPGEWQFHAWHTCSKCPLKACQAMRLGGWNSVHDRLYTRVSVTHRGICSLQVSEFRAVEALAGGAVIQEMPVHISELFLAPS